MSDAPIKRDRWDRPLIKLPDSDEVVPYRRASSFGGVLEDTTLLSKWYQRMTALGIAQNPHLQLKLAAAGENKGLLNKVCEEAMQAMGADRKADTGTSLHALTERLDRGEELGFVPDQFKADLEAYERLTRKAGFDWLEIERFLVQDELRAAGTPDRIARYDGENFIVDLKTGGVGYPHKFAVQLGIYANSKGYDARTQERRDLPEVNRDVAILISLPSGSGQAELKWLDIAKGFRAAFLADEVTEWRKTDDLIRPFNLDQEAAA